MDLYSYARRRLFAQPTGRQDFIYAFTKRTLKSVARSTGARIHTNKWVRLIDMLAMSYPETKGPAFLDDLKQHVMTYTRTHPKTCNRLDFLITYVKEYRCAMQQIKAPLFNTFEAHFDAHNDASWLVEVASRHHIVRSECGHWTDQSERFIVIGNQDAYLARRSVCSDCADYMLTSGTHIMDEGNRLFLSEFAVSYRTAGQATRVGDRRDTNIMFDATRQIYHDNTWSPYEGLIDGYHSSKAKGFHIIDSPWFRSHRRAFGCELEVQVRSGNVNAACGKVHDILNPNGDVGEYCFFERDGSIGTGFEIVTQPAGLDIHRAKFDAFLNNDDAKRGLRSHEGGACGFHVHVGRQYVTQSQIYRIQSFLNDVRNESLIRAVARRYENGFSKFKPQMAKFTPHGKNTGDRYEALNVQNSETIEFRIFRGSLRYESIIAALEFVNATLTFCTPGVTAITDFHAIGFKRFIMSDEMKPDTKFLRSYLSLDADTDNERKAA